MCSIGDDEVAEVWKRSWHRARVVHRCDVCRRIIHSGERYEKTFSVADGDAAFAAACGACAKAHDRFGRAHGFWPWPSYFVQYLRDCIDDLDGDRWRPTLNAIVRRNRRATAEAA